MTNLSTFDLVLLIGILLCLAGTVYAGIAVRRVVRLNEELFAHAKGKTVEGLLQDCVARLQHITGENQELQVSLDRAQQMLLSRVCRPVLKRYNSYEDVGGNQSFSVALLDATHSGVIVSALHSRQGAMVYAKWIEQGVSAHNLSAEEQEVLSEAMQRALG